MSIKVARVVNVKNSEYDVFIGRPSKYGNPFMIGRDGTRAEVIEKYEEWLIGARSAPNGELPPDFKQAKKDLEGRRLGCFCYPQPCHGDVLVKFFSGRKSK